MFTAVDEAPTATAAPTAPSAQEAPTEAVQEPVQDSCMTGARHCGMDVPMLGWGCLTSLVEETTAKASRDKLEEEAGQASR